MGCGSSKVDPSSASTSSHSTSVVLNVYDLTPLNNYTYWFGLGIFHSGIEVYGMEYGFGAHDYPTSGVFEVEPKSCPGFSYRCSIPLGRTNMLPFEFREFIEGVGADYHGDSYHLLLKNCNHFTEAVSLKLTGKPIPAWVNRLAHLSSMCCCLLPKTLRIEAVKGEPVYHGLPVISPDEPNESESAEHGKCHFYSSPDSEVSLMNQAHNKSYSEP